MLLSLLQDGHWKAMMPKNGKDTITLEAIHKALTRKGLDKLDKKFQGPDLTLVTKLCILDETLAYLGKDKIHLGANTGLKFALLSNLIHTLDPTAQ